MLFRSFGMDAILRAPADAYSSGLSAVEPISHRQAMGMMSPPEEPVRKEPPPPRPEREAAPVDEETIQPPGAAAAGDEPEDAGELDAAAAEPPGGDEAEEQTDPAENLPSIDPPRSWSKADKELFRNLPRETQERLVEHERSRDKDFLRRQQEATERAKALEAREREATQAKEQYEAGINQLAERAAAFIANNFAEVKTWDDVRKMAVEDPIRYNEWKVAYDQTQALQVEQQRLAAEGHREAAQRFEAYRREQTQKFLEAAPEFADPKQAVQLQTEIRSMLTEDYSVSADELDALWKGGATISLHDHRVQLLIRDAMRFRKARGEVKKPPAGSNKPAPPPPQRPGVKPAKGEVRSRTLDQADAELTRTGSRAAALRLMKAGRA